MADPLAAVGAVSAIVQLIGAVSSGLRTLRDAVVAIKDAPRVVKRLEDKILHLGQCLKMLEKYFQQRPSNIPYETRLYEVIQGIATSCAATLKILKEKTPTHLSKKNVATAFDLWLNDNAITQAKDQIDEYIPYLNLLIQTLHLLKADQNDDLLRQIAASLDQTARPRPPTQNAAVYESNHYSFETTLHGIRSFANDATAFVVQSDHTTTDTSSTYVGSLSTSEATAVSSIAPMSMFPKARRQLFHEWEQNRKDLDRLMGYRLFENAEKIQRRALLIKEELDNYHGIPFKEEERDEMEEQLADILVECKTEGSKEKALSLLEKIISAHYTADGTEYTKTSLALRMLPMARQRILNLHYKLGRLYKETGQIDLAERELRVAFNTYADDTPLDVSRIHQVGEELLEVYKYRLEFGDTDNRPVFLSQQKAFEQEIRAVVSGMGRPVSCRRTTCDKALDWCEKEGIVVSTENDEPRFDILDEEGSSPLHHAAEKCQDELALQQMLENSDTLEKQDSSGDTPLLLAVGCSNTTALAVLLRKGASVQARDRQYQTPLHRSQKPAITKSLLQHRLRRASTVTSGLFDDMRRFSSYSSFTYPLTPPDSVPNSIADNVLDIDAQDAHKKTALYLACSQGRDKIVRLLLLANADPNLAAHDHTPLAATIESHAQSYIRDPKKKVDIVAALVSRGADPEAGRKLLRSPRGMQREILKALDGRFGSQQLDSRISQDWDSGYSEQPSVPSASTKPAPVSPNALYEDTATSESEDEESPDSNDVLAAGNLIGPSFQEKKSNPTGKILPHLLRHPSNLGPSAEGQQHPTQESSLVTTFAESSSDSGFSEESAIDASARTVSQSHCGDQDTADTHRSSRFGDPEQWQRRLDELQSAVLISSSIGSCINETSPLFTRVDDYTLKLPSDAGQSLKIPDELLFSERRKLLSVVEGILKNTRNLEDAGYCGDFISVMVADANRTNVATLNCVTINDIEITTFKIKDALTHRPDVLDSRAAITCCEAFLNKLASAPKSELVDQVQRGIHGSPHQWQPSRVADHAIILCHIVLQILDLSILSYCGAHLEPLHPDFPCISGVPRLLLAPGLSLTRQKLRCLDQLLQRPVWVFDIGDVVGRQPNSPGLWLSTTIESFADVWGPAWPVAEPEQPYVVTRFDVGCGSIVGWKRAPDEPDTMDNEVFCHWISAFDPRPAELCVGGELESKRLLIGGRLTVNDGCAMRPDDFTVQMQDKNRHLDLSTGQRQWYTDARTLSWSLGGLGITAGAQETYKRRNESYRDALSTALQKDDFDSTLCVLRRRCVVEISACTGLARRQSVLYALSSPGMENYLKKSDMEWEENERCQYFELLRESLEQDSLDVVRSHLKKAPFGDLIKKALKKSFCNVLLKTGRLGKEDLAAFWSFERDGEDDPGVLISYPSWDYSWTGLLHEGSIGFNAAMVSPICLELQKRKHPSESLPCAQGPCLNNNRYTLLETLLCVNRRELEPPKGLKLVAIEDERSYYAERWSVRDIVGGEVFHLGEQGKLKILGRMKWLDSGSKRSGLLTEWNDSKPSRLREATQEIRLKIGKTAEPPCHREHLGPGRADRNGPAPIIIHVVSHGNLAMGR